MVELSGQPGEVRFTLQITRKETGKVEEVEMVGFLDQNKLKEAEIVCNPLDSSAQRGD